MAAATISNCRIREILKANVVWRSRPITIPNFVKIGRSVVDIMQFFVKIGRSIAEIKNFQIFKMAAAAILDFWNCGILWAIWMEEVETHRHAKFRQNRLIGCEGIKIFRFFFKMAAATIFDCRIREILMADVVWRSRPITIPNFVKIGHSVAEILQFFEFLREPPPPSWIFDIGKFYWLLGWRGSRRISMPNFVKIGQSVAKIFRFFKMAAAVILNWWICKILLADGVQGRGHTHDCTKFHQNRFFVFFGFSNFQNGRLRHLGFLKSWNFIGYWVERVETHERAKFR